MTPVTSEWKNALQQVIEWSQDSRIVVMGIGHDQYGDDAVGSLVVRALAPRKSARVLLIDAGNAPENHTRAIRAFKPDLVLLIDAAFMDAPPGTIRVLLPHQITGSGHHLPLSVLAAYLTAESSCRVVLLGIQPASTALDSPVTPDVMAASAIIVETLNQMISDELTSTPA